MESVNVYWCEQSETDVPTDNEWLSPRELVRLGELRFAKRIADWRLGRWTVKQALITCFQLPKLDLSDVEIRPATSGAPELYIANRPAPLTVSLSHRCGQAVCALAVSRLALGCDLELIEARSDSFVTDYFTDQEQEFIGGMESTDRNQCVTLMWSAKESALKALRSGLRLDTRDVIVVLSDKGSCLRTSSGNHWFELKTICSSGQILTGWWKHSGCFVKTIVASPIPKLPIDLWARPQRYFLRESEKFSPRIADFPMANCPTHPA